jgi:hypothetical protein
MSGNKISNVFRIKHRYLRSAHLERDFYDPSILDSYIYTDFTTSCIERLAQGLKAKSGHRAWRLTGDYGSGKSLFAILLAHWLAGQKLPFPKPIQHIVKQNGIEMAKPGFIPVLVTCSRQSLALSLLKGLYDSINQNMSLGPKSRIALEIKRRLNSKEPLDDDYIVELIHRINVSIVASSKRQGLLIILDELGKFLEFAALYPNKQDVFLLQRLAEIASRSGDKPIFIVCLLHQGFSAYSSHLDQSAQREWEKIAGRFEEVIFSQPVEQIIHLIASALNLRTDLVPDGCKRESRTTMMKAIELGWYGSVKAQDILSIAPQLYPIHPTVLPVLIRVFRHFAQNERSLFSFLFSNEPYGLMSFSEKNAIGSEFYRLSDLYDYIRTNFGHRLYYQSYRSHWNLIDSIIESYATDEPLSVRILKTVGILNLLNDSDLLATEESIVCAITEANSVNSAQIEVAIGKLQKSKRVLYQRGRAGGLCLWPHTSIDLEKAYDDASRAVETPQRVGPLLTEYLEDHSIIARKHYIETGNLRYYDIKYTSVNNLNDLFLKFSSEADGLVVIPLCETIDECETAKKFAESLETKKHPTRLIAIPQPLYNLANLLQELQRWDWIAKNVIELNADRFAGEEVTRQRKMAKEQLETRLQSLLGLRGLKDGTTLEWFYRGKGLSIADNRRLLRVLSIILEKIYSDSPKIHNELVNRSKLSAASASARMRLIDRMLKYGNSPLLGMDRLKAPPEMSIYLSVLGNTGIHREHDGIWQIKEPHYKSDRGNVLPTLRRIRAIVEEIPDNRINVSTLFSELRNPPYGVRDGIIPLLLVAFAIANEEDIVFYKDGTFIREMDSENMLVLTKAPEKFEIQYSSIEGVRSELFEKLASILQVSSASGKKAAYLEIVKKLCIFIAQLPEYAHNTNKLSGISLSVREVVLNAREPSKLLFVELPKACGHKPFDANRTDRKDVQTFALTLKKAIDELRAALPELYVRITKTLLKEFDLPSSTQRFRSTLASRSERIVLYISEPKLKSFCLRLIDTNLAENEWLESIGSLIASKPPSKWIDSDENLFNQELSSLVSRFQHVESANFRQNDQVKGQAGIRLGITRSDGEEREQVVYYTSEEESQLFDLEEKLKKFLDNNKRLGLVAASRVLWGSLNKSTKGSDD